jgi:hypothetical protein
VKVRHRSSAQPLDPRVRRRRGIAHFFKYPRSGDSNSSTSDRVEPEKKIIQQKQQEQLPIRTFVSASSNSFDSSRGIGGISTRTTATQHKKEDEFSHWSIVANKSKYDKDMKEDDVQYRLVAGHRVSQVDVWMYEQCIIWGLYGGHVILCSSGSN